MTLALFMTQMTEAERVARKLCAMDGVDPDALVYAVSPDERQRGFILVPYHQVPAWTQYEAEAARAIAAVAKP